jgi:molybdenum cofactor cytidylyltransferase
VIVASHGSDEKRVLSDALTTGVSYVALVASRTRGTAVRDALDVPDELRAQLHTPAGLDIGARTPAEIAISILAEIVAEHHARPAASPPRPRRPPRPPPVRCAACRSPSRPPLRSSWSTASTCSSAVATAATPTRGSTPYMAPGSPYVTGLVLAAGGSKRLGQPKQLLPYGETTLLGHVLDLARECPFDQRLCVIGGGAQHVRATADLTGIDVVDNPEYGEGCSSSIAAALGTVDPRADVLVLMLGDQPGVETATVMKLLAQRCDAPLAVCAYADGRGHPLAFARGTFADLATLHGDKAVWKLMDRYGSAVVDIPIDGPIPRDIDTWEDYKALAASSSA